jgi:hypothetical protein
LTSSGTSSVAAASSLAAGADTELSLSCAALYDFVSASGYGDALITSSEGVTAARAALPLRDRLRVVVSKLDNSALAPRLALDNGTAGAAPLLYPPHKTLESPHYSLHQLPDASGGYDAYDTAVDRTYDETDELCRREHGGSGLAVINTVSQWAEFAALLNSASGHIDPSVPADG